MHISRLFVVLLLFSSGAFAQTGRGILQVRVLDEHGRSLNRRLSVHLLSGTSNSGISEAFTDDAGMTEFNGLRSGTYHVTVSGEGIEEADSGQIQIDSRQPSQFVSLTVRQTDSESHAAPARSSQYSVSAKSLKVPSNAHKEFEHASSALAKKEWQKAIDHLNRAVSFYPQYVEAYNNLGVAYGRMGDKAHEREAFTRALQVDDHFGPALLNLAVVEVGDRNFGTAETYLSRALAADPLNSSSMALLANVQLLLKEFDAAIATAHKAHQMPNENALVHYVAARAYEHQRRFGDAADECKAFLQEEPSGARADAVRHELSLLQGNRATLQ